VSGFGRVALIGCGHIGGSLALALRALEPEVHIVGCDASSAAAERARTLGIVDSLAASAAEAAASARLVILAVPVGAMGTIAAQLPGDSLVTDVGSTKADVVAACEAVLGARFVGAHPMAGSERHGPDAADAALFRGRAVIVTPTERTDAAALQTITALWQSLGARVVSMAPAAHDAAVAALSHLPHVVAYALAGALAEAAPALAGLAGGSFESGTRVAASSPAAWTEILLANRAALLPWIDRFASRTAELRSAIAAGDATRLRELLAAGGAARAQIV
jgi:prephenate dehydrogenase